MKRISLIMLMAILILGIGRRPCFSQSNEAKQLMLNVEKLSQFKNILSDMKKGYTVVSQGYSRVKDIASGNFSLHEAFLDGLMAVSPAVKKYQRVAGIISSQKSIVSEYKSALRAFREADIFSSGELDYIENVYASLFDSSVRNLEDLAMVITSGKLRMSDEERLRAIDRISLDTAENLEFLQGFNRQAVMLYNQKQKEKRETGQLKMYYGQ